MALYYKIHRYLGVAVAISLVWLSFTGIFLNHTEDLKLDEKHLDNDVLFNLYGLSKPELSKAFNLGKDWVMQYGTALILNDDVLIAESKPLMSALHNDAMYILATTEQVYLFTPQGEHIDSLKTPDTLLAMGWLDEKIAIKTSVANYLANDDVTEWQTFADSTHAIAWGKASILPNELRENLEKKYRGEGPTLEQVILDTHSGRLFGKLGVYFADLIAVLTIVLTVLGVYLWSRRLRRRKK
ncbi:MAG: PepSY domain-containing protein [Cocleimonas sp.]|nr:PepSY domain-containing protein [Cocleimonas sp.]